MQIAFGDRLNKRINAFESRRSESISAISGGKTESADSKSSKFAAKTSKKETSISFGLLAEISLRFFN